MGECTTISDLAKLIQSESEKAAARHEEIKSIKVQQNQQESRIVVLETVNCYLNQEVKTLAIALAEMQQEPLKSNVTVRGVPEIETSDATLESLVTAIMEKAEPNAEYQIQSVKRVGAKKTGSHRPILIKFMSATDKEQFLNEREKGLNCADIIFNGNALGTEDKQIFFGDHLGPLSAKISFLTRSLKKRGVFKYTWVRNVKIYVRVSDGDVAIQIRHVDQLKDLVRASKSDLNSSGSTKGPLQKFFHEMQQKSDRAESVSISTFTTPSLKKNGGGSSTRQGSRYKV